MFFNFPIAIATEVKAAVIFLIALAAIVGLLVGIYFALKKDICNCHGGSKKNDEEEELVDEEMEEGEKTGKEPINGVIVADTKIDDQPEKTEDVKEDQKTEDSEKLLVPEIIVTESSFRAEKPAKRASSFKSVFKKITKPIGKVRFGGVSSKAAPEDFPLTSADEQGYGAMQRSDSMESFLSGVSVVSENIEEFGPEVSPGRLQVSLEYDKRNWTLIVGVKQADCLLHTGKDKVYWQVHVTFLPFKKHRFKTKYKSTSTPMFNQTFEVDEIAEQALSQLAVRFRVYGRLGKTGKKKLAGESIVDLDFMQGAQGKKTEWHILKRGKTGQGGKLV